MNWATTANKNAKLIGAMKHLLLQLQKTGSITDDDREHLLNRYIRGHITGFGHIAELLYGHNQTHPNYAQIVNYGIYYGENHATTTREEN